MRDAMLCSIEGNKIRCGMCRHRCLIPDGACGVCGVRCNNNGRIDPVYYAHPCSEAVDPIEKKPLFHVKPSSLIYSIACPGCNFKCSFCQNWSISQVARNCAKDSSNRNSVSLTDEVTPEAVVESAIQSGCNSIAYTYTEPTVYFEYAYDIAKLAHQKGLLNVFVTNGYMSREAIDEIAPYLDAANVDLKAFKSETYRKIMKADLEGVLDSIQYMKKKGIWIEITTLVVPGMNDDESELNNIANFISKIDINIPWHVSRFHPEYNLQDTPITPVHTLRMAYDIGKQNGLRYVYTGNIPGDEAENTYCYNCGELLIKRYGFKVVEMKMSGSLCPSCSSEIAGIF